MTEHEGAIKPDAPYGAMQDHGSSRRGMIAGGHTPLCEVSRIVEEYLQ